MAKLSLVIILIVLLVIMRIHTRKAMKVQGGPSLLKIKKIGQITLPLAIAIVILVVLMFH